MKCVSCDGRIVFSNPDFCKTHFIDYFEKKVTETIKKFKLITEDDLRKGICAGVSGGKDSLTVLYILSKYFGMNVKPEIDNKKLNRSYGLIGAEQHLVRFPGDAMASHLDPGVAKNQLF